MAINYVGGIGAVDATSGTTLTTASYTVAAGSLLVATWRHLHDNVAGSGTPTVTISDSRGNIWATADSETSGISGVQDGWRLGIAYAMNAAAGATTFTMTISNSRQNRGIAILEYSGAATSSALLATAKNRGGGTNTISSSSFSASGNNLTVVTANTINGANLVDWTGIAVGGNAATLRTGLDASAYLGQYVSAGSLSGATSAATNNNPVIYKIIVSASFAEAVPYEARITWAEAQYQSSGVSSSTDYSSPLSRGIFRGIERGVA